MLVKISPLSIHTRVTRIETATPLSNSCSDMSVVRLCPHLNQLMFQLIDIRYVCLVHLLLHDTPERIVSRISDAISQVSVRTACNILNDVMCYVTPGKGLTPVVSM